MRINRENIDYNAMREINALVNEIYEATDDSDDFDNIRIAALGEIKGICRFAEIMKEVLEA